MPFHSSSAASSRASLQHMSLLQVVALAKLQEDKFMDCRRSSRPQFAPYVPSVPPVLSPSPIPSQPHVVVKCLSSEELAVLHDKGLCYHCKDKWIPGHQCKSHLHLLIADDDVDTSFSIKADTDATTSFRHLHSMNLHY